MHLEAPEGKASFTHKVWVCLRCSEAGQGPARVDVAALAPVELVHGKQRCGDGSTGGWGSASEARPRRQGPLAVFSMVARAQLAGAHLPELGITPPSCWVDGGLRDSPCPEELTFQTHNGWEVKQRHREVTVFSQVP